MCGLCGKCWVNASFLSCKAVLCKRIPLFAGNTNIAYRGLRGVGGVVSDTFSQVVQDETSACVCKE